MAIEQNTNKEDVNNGGQNQQQGGQHDNNKNDQQQVKTYTQEEVNAMMAKEKDQGRRQGSQQVTGLEGVDPKLFAQMIADYQAKKNAELSPEQREAEIKKQYEQQLAERDAKTNRLEAETKSMKLGVKAEYVEDVVDMVIARQQRGDKSELSTMLSEIKTKHSHMFGKEDSDGDKNKGDGDKNNKQKAGQRGTGGNVNVKNEEGSKGKGDEPGSLGKRLAQSKLKSAGVGEGSKRKKYWGN